MARKNVEPLHNVSSFRQRAATASLQYYYLMALHTSTVLARTPAAISSYLTRVATTFGGDHPFLFSLSANAPELQTLVSRLTTFSSQTTGCLSAPLPGPASDGLISCSIGLFDVKKATPFRSIIPGRAAPQVGRWHAFRQRDDPAQEFPPGMEEGLAEGVNWADVWDRSAGNNLLPLELQALMCVSCACCDRFS